MPEITQEHLDAAMEALQEAKSGTDLETHQRAQQEAAELRTAWRAQEVAAGRRSADHGIVVTEEEG